MSMNMSSIITNVQDSIKSFNTIFVILCNNKLYWPKLCSKETLIFFIKIIVYR